MEQFPTNRVVHHGTIPAPPADVPPARPPVDEDSAQQDPNSLNERFAEMRPGPAGDAPAAVEAASHRPQPLRPPRAEAGGDDASDANDMPLSGVSKRKVVRVLARVLARTISTRLAFSFHKLSQHACRDRTLAACEDRVQKIQSALTDFVFAHDQERPGRSAGPIFQRQKPSESDFESRSCPGVASTSKLAVSSSKEGRSYQKDDGRHEEKSCPPEKIINRDRGGPLDGVKKCCALNDAADLFSRLPQLPLRKDEPDIVPKITCGEVNLVLMGGAGAEDGEKICLVDSLCESSKGPAVPWSELTWAERAALAKNKQPTVTEVKKFVTPEPVPLESPLSHLVENLPGRSKTVVPAKLQGSVCEAAPSPNFSKTDVQRDGAVSSTDGTVSSCTGAGDILERARNLVKGSASVSSSVLGRVLFNQRLAPAMGTSTTNYVSHAAGVVPRFSRPSPQFSALTPLLSAREMRSPFPSFGRPPPSTASTAAVIAQQRAVSVEPMQSPALFNFGRPPPSTASTAAVIAQQRAVSVEPMQSPALFNFTPLRTTPLKTPRELSARPRPSLDAPKLPGFEFQPSQRTGSRPRFEFQPSQRTDSAVAGAGLFQASAPASAGVARSDVSLSALVTDGAHPTPVLAHSSRPSSQRPVPRMHLSITSPVIGAKLMRTISKPDRPPQKGAGQEGGVVNIRIPPAGNKTTEKRRFVAAGTGRQGRGVAAGTGERQGRGPPAAALGTKPKTWTLDSCESGASRLRVRTITNRPWKHPGEASARQPASEQSDEGPGSTDGDAVTAVTASPSVVTVRKDLPAAGGSVEGDGTKRGNIKPVSGASDGRKDLHAAGGSAEGGGTKRGNKTVSDTDPQSKVAAAVPKGSNTTKTAGTGAAIVGPTRAKSYGRGEDKEEDSRGTRPLKADETTADVAVPLSMRSRSVVAEILPASGAGTISATTERDRIDRRANGQQARSAAGKTKNDIAKAGPASASRPVTGTEGQLKEGAADREDVLSIKSGSGRSRTSIDNVNDPATQARIVERVEPGSAMNKERQPVHPQARTSFLTNGPPLLQSVFANPPSLLGISGHQNPPSPSSAGSNTVVIPTAHDSNKPKRAFALPPPMSVRTLNGFLSPRLSDFSKGISADIIARRRCNSLAPTFRTTVVHQQDRATTTSMSAGDCKQEHEAPAVPEGSSVVAPPLSSSQQSVPSGAEAVRTAPDCRTASSAGDTVRQSGSIQQQTRAAPQMGSLLNISRAPRQPTIVGGTGGPRTVPNYMAQSPAPKLRLGVQMRLSRPPVVRPGGSGGPLNSGGKK